MRLPPIVALIALLFTLGLVALLFTVGLVALLFTVGLIALLFTVGLVALLFTVGLPVVAQDQGRLPEVGRRVTRASFAHCMQINAPGSDGASNQPGQRRRRTFPACHRRLVDVTIMVLVVSHCIADNAAYPILSLGALIRTPQEFLLIEVIFEQICLVGLQCTKAMLL